MVSAMLHNQRQFATPTQVRLANERRLRLERIRDCRFVSFDCRTLPVVLLPDETPLAYFLKERAKVQEWRRRVLEAHRNVMAKEWDAERARRSLDELVKSDATPSGVDVDRDLLKHFGRVRLIISIVAKHFHVGEHEIVGHRRTQRVAEARQTGMFIAKRMTGQSLAEIGRRFGGRDHTTVIHAVKKMERRMATDPDFAESIILLEQSVRDVAGR